MVLERGGFVSYANCGLPYYIGGVIGERRKLTLQTPESFKRRFNVDVARTQRGGADPARKEAGYRAYGGGQGVYGKTMTS